MQRIARIDLGGVNCYLIENEGKYLLVDTGGYMFLDRTYDSRERVLDEKLAEYKVTKENLKLLILTHGDCDHVMNAAYLHQVYDVPIAMAKEDVYMTDHPSWDCYKDNTKFSSGIFSLAIKLMSKKIEGLMHKVYQDFVSFQPDILLEEGMDLSKYGFDGTVYHTPGHTKGSICIMDSEGNLFCGDLFANNPKPSLAGNASDFEVLRQQAGRMYALSPTMIYPGHGTPFQAEKIRL